MKENTNSTMKSFICITTLLCDAGYILFDVTGCIKFLVFVLKIGMYLGDFFYIQKLVMNQKSKS